MQRSTIAFALLALATACSVTLSESPTDAAATLPDEGAPIDEAGSVDSGPDATTPTTPTVPAGGVCTAEKKCDADSACLALQGATAGTCAKKCETRWDCGNDDDHVCEKINGTYRCLTTCVFSDWCPSGFRCSSARTCEPNCTTYPGSCGSKFECKASGSCGDPTPPPCTPQATSGLSSTKTAGSLSSTEKGTFCDWQACQLGGYGNKASCDGGVATNPSTDQNACIAKFPKSTCAATVSEMEACAKVQAAQRCSTIILTAPECATLRACM